MEIGERLFFRIILYILFGILYCIIYFIRCRTTKRKGSTSTKVERSVPKEEIDNLLNSLVQIPGQDYLISKFQVTQQLWKSIMGFNLSYFKRENFPVDGVSWNKCNEFIEKLNSNPKINEAGITFCLPTKEEWEYACRAGSVGEYGLLESGNEGTLDEMGWYDANSNCEPHAVGTKTPNAWGIYDMHGNVWEWTSTISGNCAIIKGGAFISKAEKCTINSVKTANIEKNFSNIGLRLCAKKNKGSENIEPLPKIEVLSKCNQDSSLDVPLFGVNDRKTNAEQLNPEDDTQAIKVKRKDIEKIESQTFDTNNSDTEGNEVERKLIKLSSLKAKGLITEEEYKELRKKTILKL